MSELLRDRGGLQVAGYYLHVCIVTVFVLLHSCDAVRERTMKKANHLVTEGGGVGVSRLMP